MKKLLPFLGIVVLGLSSCFDQPYDHRQHDRLEIHHDHDHETHHQHDDHLHRADSLGEHSHEHSHDGHEH